MKLNLAESNIELNKGRLFERGLPEQKRCVCGKVISRMGHVT